MFNINDFQFFLFDFDGLLVNTEEIHFQSYVAMCQKRGIKLLWKFSDFCNIAHYTSHGLRDQLYLQYPALYEQEPNWEVLYAEKKNCFLELLDQGAVHLMPGVEFFLKKLEEKRLKRAVVTHSAKVLIDKIKSQHPVLNTIPLWITREHYTKPKPDPECYLKTISNFAAQNDKVIGFEDTPRGLQALMGTRATPVLISQISYPEIPALLQQGVSHFPTLTNLFETK